MRATLRIRRALIAAAALTMLAPSAAIASTDAAAVARQADALLREAFERLDRDRDGRLDAEEAPAYARTRGPLDYQAFLRALDAPPAPRAEAKNPVLILPGFLMPEPAYQGLRRALLRAGHPDVTVLKGWPWCASIGHYTAQAKREIDAALARTGARRIELVAHSMGGLIGRDLIQNHGYEAKIAHLISFGTPHHGTQLGPLSSWYAVSAAEMTPGSAFLAALNAQEGRASTVKLVSVHAQIDEIVWPPESVDLAGAANPMLPNTMHITGALTPAFAALVIAELER